MLKKYSHFIWLRTAVDISHKIMKNSFIFKSKNFRICLKFNVKIYTKKYVDTVVLTNERQNSMEPPGRDLLVFGSF